MRLKFHLLGCSPTQGSNDPRIPRPVWRAIPLHASPTTEWVCHCVRARSYLPLINSPIEHNKLTIDCLDGTGHHGLRTHTSTRPRTVKSANLASWDGGSLHTTFVDTERPMYRGRYVLRTIIAAV